MKRLGRFEEFSWDNSLAYASCEKVIGSVDMSLAMDSEAAARKLGVFRKRV